MTDHDPKKSPLSEISHLFLSEVRDRQTAGAPRPLRIAPGGARDERRSVDLTPEEFARVVDSSRPAPSNEPAPMNADTDAAAPAGPPRLPPVTAVIGAHLGGRQFDHVKRYARHLAARIGRVGLIEVDAAEFRLMCFDPAAPGAQACAAARQEPSSDPTSAECFDPRHMAEAIDELSWDVQRWLLLLPNPRTPEARSLLREAGRWVLLSTCDHDGVVSSYRMLKGLLESEPAAPAADNAHCGGARPRLTLSLLDAVDEAESVRVFRKLAGVCDQFLRRRLEPESPVSPADGVVEHLVMFCRPTRDKAQLAAAPQWPIIARFLARAKGIEPEIDAAPEPSDAVETGACKTEMAMAVPAEPEITKSEAPAIREVPPPAPAARRFVGDLVLPAEPAEPSFAMSAPPHLDPEVMDLPGPDASSESILGAILGRRDGGLVECPVRAPMCQSARLAVGRDRSVVLLAVARQGLADIKSIGQAYRWLIENCALIGMAVPQFAINPDQAPRLRLLVDHGDISAEVLQSMLQGGNVTVQAYRKLRWGGKTGLLLDAA